MGIFILATLFSASGWAASCCGNSLAGFPVIFNKQKFLFSITQSYTEGRGRVENKKYTSWSGKSRAIHSTVLQSAWSLSDRLQLSGGVPLLNSSYQDKYGAQNASIAGDTVVTLNYETLPEFTYSKWRPNIYNSLVMILPTGRSVFESKLSEMSDVTGFNHFGVGTAITAKKVWFPTTLLLQAKAIYLQEKSFGDIKVKSFWEYSLITSLSYALSVWDLTISPSFMIQNLEKRDARNTRNGLKLDAKSILNFSPQLSIQKVSDPWSFAVSISDQTIEKVSQNTIINQSIAFNISYLLN